MAYCMRVHVYVFDCVLMYLQCWFHQRRLEICLDANNSTETMMDQLGEEQGPEEGSVQVRCGLVEPDQACLGVDLCRY